MDAIVHLGATGVGGGAGNPGKAVAREFETGTRLGFGDIA